MKYQLLFSLRKLPLFFFVILFFLLFNDTFAQSPLVKKWDARFGGDQYEWLTSSILTADGGYLLGGYTASDAGGDKTQNTWGSNADYDYWIVKIDSNGSKQWDKDYGGTDFDYLTSVIQTADGGYMIGGYSKSGIGGNKTQNTKGLNDYWILKTDALGNVLWNKDYGGSGEDKLNAVLQTADGGYLLAGSSSSGINGDKSQFSKGGTDYWVLKIDSVGNKLWDVDYGATLTETFQSVIKTTGDGFLICGTSNSNAGGDKSQNTYGSTDFWIIKINSSGVKQWDKDFGGTNTEALHSVLLTPDSGFILAGFSTSNSGGTKSENTKGVSDYWILKTDFLGTKLWDKDYGGTATDDCGSVSLTADGGYLLCGNSQSVVSGNKTERNVGSSQSWIIKLNSAGDFEWNKTIFSLDQELNSIAFVTGSNYVIANHTKSEAGYYKLQSSRGGFDYWIAKFRDENCWSTYDTLNAVICHEYISPGGILKWQLPGTYLDVFPNQSGCDSIVTFYLTTANTTSTLNLALCPGDTMHSPSGNYIWTTTGYYKDTIPNASGCDSLMTITLTTQESFAYLSGTTCTSIPYISPSGNYSWSAPGTYHDTIPNAAGCDSVMIFTLVSGNSYSNINGMVCPGIYFISPSGNYSWNTTGTHHDTIPNAKGCDSVITIHLFSGNSSSTIFGNACSVHTYISPSGNYAWNLPGTYYDTIPNAIGCDSLMTIILSTSTTSYINAGVCDNVSYVSPSGHIWSIPGIYHDTIPNSVGCDSIITIYLSTSNSTSFVYSSVCGNAPYISPSGNYSWSVPGTYHDTINNSIGCDSIITIVLSPQSASSNILYGCDSVISPSGNYIWTTSGTYMDTISSFLGCDSVMTITVNLISINTSVNVAGITLTTNETTGNYQWIDCNHGYTFIAGASNRSFTPLTDGSYAVIIIKYGCYDTSACHTVLVNGIQQENPGAEMFAYVNTASTDLIITLYGWTGSQAVVTLHDILGKQISIQREPILSNGTDPIILTTPVSELKNGIYFFSVTDGEKTVSGKFVISR